MIAAVLFMAAQVPPDYVPRLLASQQAYAQCMNSQTLRLGSGNSEPGDNVVAAARSECRPAFESWVKMLPESFLLSVPQMLDTQTVRTVRIRVEGEALAALLEARAHRP